jgi:TPR repeat protein/putative methionine-R-sulfoxide reductase with GAF domain
MSAPLASSSPNRRRRVRHKVRTPAYASFTTKSQGAMLDLNEIVDISEDGVAIQCNSPLQADSQFDLCLDLAESSGPIQTTGQVIWSHPSGRCGLRFSALSNVSLVRLREWLFLNAMAGVANAEVNSASNTWTSHAEEVRPQPNYTDTLAVLTAVQREVGSLGSNLAAALQLIAARTQTLTKASGAALALAEDEPDFMICRASSGPDAPPVGAKLQVGDGFSGECVRTGKLLRCDDTETDLRVNRESCRDLGIRSILAAPVRDGEKVIGLLEVFSPQANTFTENDSTILQRMAETILAAVNHKARAEDRVATAASTASSTSSPGSTLFASIAGPKQEYSSEEHSHGGIRLPRSHLIILICAAATIALALGFLIARESVRARGTLREQTVLASSQPPTAMTPSTASLPTFDTSTFAQLQKTAEQGDPAAENALGLRYATGEGVKLNEKEAFRWFTKAAEQGNLSAQFRLGSFYWGGRGVPQNLNEAYFWIVLARAGGDNSSKALATVLASHMTRAQAITIEQQASEWLLHHPSNPRPAAGR